MTKADERFEQLRTSPDAGINHVSELVRSQLGTTSPDRYIIIEREYGLVKVYLSNALGSKDPGNRITLEDAEARGVAKIINELFPVPRPLSKGLTLSIMLNAVFLAYILQRLF